MTLPGNAVCDPSGTTVAVWPTATALILVTSTEVVTSKPPPPWTTMFAVVDAALTLAPGVMPTAITVPAIGLVIVAWPRAWYAAATPAVAASTAAWYDARSAAVGAVERAAEPANPLAPDAPGPDAPEPERPVVP